MKILIVEDSPTQAEQLKNILEENSYQVLIATNGQDALNKINDYAPQLVISDILMPEMNGYELCKALRQHERFKHILFILLSTLSDLEDIVSGLESGANYIITKPYHVDDLLGHLSSAIKIHKIRESELDENNVQFLLNGHVYMINAKKSRIMDFLASIYAAAVQKNIELYNTRLELQKLNNMLEKKVEERTAALRIESEERKRYEQQFLEAQKLESMGKLTGGIAHDFNNLLLIALGNLELLNNTLQENSAERNHVKQAVTALERGSSLTKHLLSFARKQTLFPKSVDVCEHLTSIITLLKPALSERIDISTSFEENLWPIWIDPMQFENAIMNIAINARDAMHNAGKIHFEVSNATMDENIKSVGNPLEHDDYVKISITDQGEGMPKEIMAKIFEPFFTTKRMGMGTGLGLSMVYGFIKQSNGHITVDSEIGRGTTFNLYLPRSNIAIRQEEEIITPKKLASLCGDEVILIVEDEALLLKLVFTYLKQLGYDVLTASTGMEALALIKSGKRIDLLFSDVIMPGNITGPALAVEAKKLMPHIKILLTSGYSKDILNQSELTLGEIQHLTKPYKLDALATKLRAILREKSYG